MSRRLTAQEAITVFRISEKLCQ